jgi:hypothetical protein
MSAAAAAATKFFIRDPLQWLPRVSQPTEPLFVPMKRAAKIAAKISFSSNNNLC